jgi:hypothetical protein
MIQRSLLGTVLLALTACGADPADDDITREVVSDSGALCFTSNPDGSVEVLVSFDTCLSSSCDRVLASSCSMREDGGAFTVTSRAEIQRRHTDCTADCGAVNARCTSAPIPPGTYLVKYGELTAELTLPTSPTERFPIQTPFDDCH